MSRPRGRPPRATSALVPAGARGEATLAEVEAVLNEEAVEVFARAVGGREALADALAVAGTGSEIEQITTLLLDPRYAQWGLARLCTMVGLTVADLFTAYRKAAITKAHIEATHIIAAKLPPIVRDVMDKALSDPTVERHKLALELGQLLEKKGGLIVQQNNLAQTVNATGTGSLEQLQQAVGDLLFGERRPPEPPDVIIEAPPRRPDGDDEEEEDDDADADKDDRDDADRTPPRGLPETPVKPLVPPADPPEPQP